ncbi:MAG: FAD-binding oxidoreductase [Rhodobacteraceae bacterium]|nr:FAD-binding oxidoreductase [Paracoccaceae bacterium]
MEIKTSPFWWEFKDWETRPRSAPEIPEKLDAAIIGAGFSGLNTALVLARAGLKVAVFEAGAFGEGASSRNGGMVGPSFHKLGVLGLRQQFGEAVANEILRESVGFVDHIESFLASENIDADFKRRGRFLGARSPAAYNQYARMLETLKSSCGVSGHMVPKAEQGAETGSSLYHGGVVFDRDGGLNPAKYLAGLAKRVIDAGAAILPFSPVSEINRTRFGFSLSCNGKTIQVAKVAICTNGYTGAQFGALRRRVLPLRSAIIATEELPETLMERLMPRQRMYGDSRRMVAYYRPSPDGKRILFGSRATSLKEQPSANAHALRRMMLEVFPDLSATKITHVWSGLVAYSFDHSPHIGQINGLYYAMGYCGSGVSRASYFGQKLGHKMLDQHQEGRTAFDALPFPTRPLYTGNPWFMPAIIRWHSLLDSFKL